MTLSAPVTISSTQGADRISDENLTKRVKDALHSDPYFYDEHGTVSVENGAVVLRGIVSSEWDLRHAVRIAVKAAAHRRVIDDLSIEDNLSTNGVTIGRGVAPNGSTQRAKYFRHNGAASSRGIFQARTIVDAMSPLARA